MAAAYSSNPKDEKDDGRIEPKKTDEISAQQKAESGNAVAAAKQ